MSKIEPLLRNAGIDIKPISKNEKFRLAPDLCIDDTERFIGENVMFVKPHLSESIPGERISIETVYSFLAYRSVGY